MFGEKRPVFILKTGFPVMFRLILNVLPDGGNIGFTDGKCTVTRLPCEGTKLSALRFNPFGGCFFLLLRQRR